MRGRPGIRNALNSSECRRRVQRLCPSKHDASDERTIRCVVIVDIFVIAYIISGMPRRQAHATVFLAIADPTRRAMLELLGSGDKSAGELGEPTRLTQPAVSQHLRVLRDARSEERRVGKEWRSRCEPLRVTQKM